MDILFTQDFDFTISDVLLAHRCQYVPGYKSDFYSKGRKISGIVYCLNGVGVYQFKKQILYLHPGELIFLPESTAYSVSCFGNITFEHITVNFNIPTEQLCTLLPFDYCELAGRMITADNLNLKTLLDKLLYIWQHKARGYRVMSKALVYELIYKYFLLLGNTNCHHSDYERIEPAKKLLDIHFTEDIPVSELAAVCGFSETHFRRLFVRLFHVSPTEYRMNKRILLAKDLLLINEYTISEIAHTIGFHDANYFSRIFKAHTGMSPTEYSQQF